MSTLLSDGPRVINIGLEAFADEISTVGGSVVSVSWKPPAGGDPETLARLIRMTA
jgi:hypothetical protein